jgi:hypothetical protein
MCISPLASTVTAMPRRANKPILATLSQAKQNALQAIRSSWKITNISEMLSNGANTSFKQKPPNDDFFNEETLVLFQQLAKLTEHKKKEVKTKLEVRWSARAHHRADGPHKAGDIKVGGTNKIKNENLHADLEEFIRDFGLDTEEQTDNGQGEERSALTKSGGMCTAVGCFYLADVCSGRIIKFMDGANNRFS